MADKSKTRRAPSRSPAEKSPAARGRAGGAFTRRGFIKTTAVAGGAAAVGTEAARAAGKPKVIAAKKGPVTLNVNGKDVRLSLEPRVTLARALRNYADLTGTKEICDRGACGGCGVLVDGQLVNSCMMLALDAVGKKVRTVEGLAKGEELSPLQAAFVKHDALQCGFCTPGMLMTGTALLERNPSPSLAEIKRGFSGNLCRCGTYTRIFAAVQTVAKS
jgi:aerobic-type carbon monoxide dehydrogenase small subunit (CoxS/CutS family)